MSVSVIAHDTRLEGRVPVSSSSMLTFDVSEATPLGDFFNECRSVAVTNGGISTLYIMAHGAEMSHAGSVGGGYGIIFCREYILPDNVNRFALLADKVEHIVLLVCSAAAVSPTFRRIDIARPELAQTFHGDGNELCRQMAIHAQCRVTAARELQAYVTHGDRSPSFAGRVLMDLPGTIDFGEWEGSVVQYDEHGNIINEWTNPSAWRDESGGIHDPRIDPRPRVWWDEHRVRHES